jgi:hypothetical protein
MGVTGVTKGHNRFYTKQLNSDSENNERRH